jgi:hypothetical protein
VSSDPGNVLSPPIRARCRHPAPSLEEELQSPRAPDDKWRGRTWKAVGKVERDLKQSIPENESYDSDLALHYRCTRFGFGRHAYRQHGDHSDPERLKRRITASFKHLLKKPVANGLRTAEKELSDLVDSAISLDFWKHFSVIEWSDPFTGKESGFPARQHYDDGAVAMKGQFLHHEHDHTTVWDHEVELIRQPFLRIFGHADKPHGFPLYSARNLDFFLAGPAHVFVNCARRPPPEIDGEGGGSREDGESEEGYCRHWHIETGVGGQWLGSRLGFSCSFWYFTIYARCTFARKTHAACK